MLECLPRRRQIVPLECEDPEVGQRNAALGRLSEHTLEHPSRFGRVRGLRVRDAERVQRVGVGLGIVRERLEDLHRWSARPVSVR